MGISFTVVYVLAINRILSGLVN